MSSAWKDAIDEGYEDFITDNHAESVPAYAPPAYQRDSPASSASTTSEDDTDAKSGDHRRARSLNSVTPIEVPKIDIPPKEASATTWPPGVQFSIDQFERCLDIGNDVGAQSLLEKCLRSIKLRAEQAKILHAAAESYKRKSRLPESLAAYERAVESDPSCIQAILDYAKTLDEVGQPGDCENVLRVGVMSASANEQLSSKLIHQFEKRFQLFQAKKLLGSLFQKFPIKDCGNSLLEGVLLEVRHGRADEALSLFSLIEKQFPVKSGFYVDLADYLRRCGLSSEALRICKLGTSKYPTMPNNWAQMISYQPSAAAALEAYYSSIDHLSKPSLPKIILTTATVCACLGDIKASRSLISEDLISNPPDSRWRIAYNAAILEYEYGDKQIVPLLLDYSRNLAPSKSLSTILLAMAKELETNGDIASCYKVYSTLFSNCSSDWRVFLEHSMFLFRRGDSFGALHSAERGLEMHPTNGRLLALRVQLESEDRQIEILKDSLQIAPKSGELWLEACRISLNPLSAYFNLKSARFYLEMAYLFTPQYVDIFIEMVRLELLEGGNVRKAYEMFLGGEGSYSTLVFMFRKLGSEFSDAEFKRIIDCVKADLVANRKLYSRAIARSSFVVSSIRNEEIRLKADCCSDNPPDFRFGLTCIPKAFADLNSKDREAIIRGNSSAFV